MSVSIQSMFPEVRRAPKRDRPAGRCGTEVLIRGAASVVITECLSGKPGGFTALDVLQRVETFATTYTHANALGTALGHGVCSRGLGLHRDEQGHFRRCRENAVLAALRLSDEELESLSSSLGLDSPEELVEVIGRLPPAPVEPAA